MQEERIKILIKIGIKEETIYAFFETMVGQFINLETIQETKTFFIIIYYYKLEIFKMLNMNYVSNSVHNINLV